MHAQLCSTLCDPVDCSPPSCSVRGISQGRLLEWVAISFSRGSSWPKDWTHISCVSCILYHWDSLPLSHLGSPKKSSARRDRQGIYFDNVVTDSKNERSREELIWVLSLKHQNMYRNIVHQSLQVIKKLGRFLTKQRLFWAVCSVLHTVQRSMLPHGQKLEGKQDTCCLQPCTF